MNKQGRKRRKKRQGKEKKIGRQTGRGEKTETKRKKGKTES